MNAPKGRFLPLGKSAHITEGQVPDAPETCLTGTCLYKNERVVRTKESYKQKSPHGRSHGSRHAVIFLADGISEEQREAINYFNSKLTPLGWHPVTKISEELEKALEIFEAEDIRGLTDDVVGNSSDVRIPKRKTLVRLLWDNY